jgi:hypothetical protein
MTNRPEKASLFNVGDQVRVVSPTPERGKQGILVEVMEPLGDLVYRYRVRFNDGSSQKFFGFELEKTNSMRNGRNPTP